MLDREHELQQPRTSRLVRLAVLVASCNDLSARLLDLADAMPSGEWRAARAELAAQHRALAAAIEAECHNSNSPLECTDSLRAGNGREMRG